MQESPISIHEVIFAATALMPVWLPALALAIFWQRIDKKLFYVVGGMLASSGIQHFFSFMHLWQLAHGAALFNESEGWNSLAIQTMILALPVLLLASAYLYWSMKLLPKERLGSQFDADDCDRRST